MREKTQGFEGEEVSCRAVGYFFDELARRKLPLEILSTGTGYTPEHLRDRDLRISWDGFCRLSANFRSVWTEEELGELGARLVQSSRLRPFALVTRLLYTAADVYRTVGELSSVDFTCVENIFEDRGGGEIHVELRMAEGYEPSHEFFVITRGMFTAVPVMIGLGSAEVEMREVAGGAIYEIRAPLGGGGWLRWLRKIVAWPFTVMTTARELQLANKRLYLKQGELQGEIAERKRIAEALREREEQYRLLVENSPYSIVQLDEEGRVLAMNPAGESMLGDLTGGSFDGLSFFEFVAEGHDAYVRQLFDHALSGGAPGFHFESSKGRYMQATFVPVSSLSQGTRRVMALVQDITERERAEQELRTYAREMSVLNHLMAQGVKAQELYGLLEDVATAVCDQLDLTASTVYSLSEDGQTAELRYTSSAAAPSLPAMEPPYKHLFHRRKSLSSVDHPEIVGDPASDLENKSEAKMGRHVLMVPIIGGQQNGGQRVIGSLRVTSTREILAPKARTLGAVGQQLGTFIDRLEAKEEQERLMREMEGKTAELERFAYTVSHDLKNPVFTIHGYLGFLEKNVEHGRLDRVAADLGPIRTAITEMRSRLDALLDVTRIGRVVNTVQRIPLDDLVEEAVGNVADQIEERNVQVMISRDLPEIEADRPRMLEVVQNLISNAVKYMGDQPEPRIEIEASVRDGETVCIIRDNGIGIDPRYHQKVFDLFDQLDPEHEGSGVGLTIVKRIIENHGGRIWVESDGLGEGSSFIFTLPAAVREIAAQRAQQGGAPQGETP